MTASTTAQTPAQQSDAVPRRAWAVLAVVLVAEVMDLVDGTVVNVAGPAVRREIGGSTAFLQWLGAGYTLAFAVLLITGGRLGDIFGRRRMFLVGIGGFTAASLACALAQSPDMLIATRVLQGGFGAMLLPQGFGLLKEAFPARHLGKAFAAFGPVMGLSAVAGPILGGALVDADLFGTGWRLIFLMNVPLGLVGIAAGGWILPRPAARDDRRLDLGAVAVVSASAAALIYPLIQGRELGWPLWSFFLMAAGVAGFGLLAVVERRSAMPLIEPGLLRNRAFTSGIAVSLAFFAAMMGLMLVLSLFCQLGLGFSPLKTGLAMAPLPLGIVFTAPASFALVPRFGRKVIQAGLVAELAGLGLLGAITAHTGAGTTTWDLAPGMFVAGLGMGLVLAPLFDLILGGVADEEIGSGTGLLNALEQLAGAIGLAVIGTVFFAFTDHGTSSPDAFSHTALIALAPVVVALALSFALPRRAAAEREEGAV